MMGYRDRTFCAESSQCANESCIRRFTERDRQLAIKWWGSDDFPVAISNFKDTAECIGFKPIGGNVGKLPAN